MCLAIPGKIVEITNEDSLTRSGRISFGGIVKEINLAFVPEGAVGDYVIVHAGFALSVLDEVEAQRTLKDFAEIQKIAAELNKERA